MKITHLYTKSDNKSYFEDIEIDLPFDKELGKYSHPLQVRNMYLRELNPGSKFDWHPAPQKQYIIYLEGKVKVTASGGEERIFNAGDILLAADVSGKGHISETLTHGRSLVITEE